MHDADADVTALAPSNAVRLAATFVTLSGFVSALSGVQTLLSVTFVVAWAKPIPYAMLAVGLFTMFAGTQLYRVRGWAAAAAIAASALLTLGMGAWVWFAGKNGFLSCLTLLVPIGAPIAAVLSLRALPDVRRADLVRERMQDAGMDLGI
jgi:hypothetical protein